MYDLLFVKKRRRRRIAALVALFSSIGVASLVIISFLGRTVGTFTVALKNSEVQLALCEKKDSTNYSTYLRANSSTNYIEHSYDFFKDKLDVLDQDNDITPVTVGEKDQTYIDDEGNIQKGKCLEFFKYTFYVKNIGSKTAAYSLKINIDDRTRADDNTGRSLDDTLRVMVFENKPDSGEHNHKIFAKKPVENNLDIDGNPTPREFIVYDERKPNRETEDYRLVDASFESGDTVVEYDVASFIKNETMRYTIVFWLEGGDPQSQPGSSYPKGATLKLGVDIVAHENS